MCNAMEELVPYVFGWPAILTALVMAVAGAASRKIPLLLVGAIVIMPFSIYLGETPRFEVVGFFMPMLFLGSAYALRQGLRWVAWSLLLPYVGVIGWFASVVLQQ